VARPEGRATSDGLELPGRAGSAVSGKADLHAGAEFYRAHGLGNDYLVFRASGSGSGWPVTAGAVHRVCDRQAGLGGDGIVVLLDPDPSDGIFPLRMFNPDGSEFERSGNGLRVLAAALHHDALVGEGAFRVRSGGDVIPMEVHSAGPDGVYDVSVEMGRASFGSEALGLDGTRLDARGRVAHPELGLIEFVPVSVGNPHAVLFPPDPSDELLRTVGPFLSTHSAFPAGTNVQVVQVFGPSRIRIWIWERGVGRTSASGTSSCASAAAAVHTGRLEPGPIAVEMDGGELSVTVAENDGIILRGPVQEVAAGRLTSGFVEGLSRGG